MDTVFKTASENQEEAPLVPGPVQPEKKAIEPKTQEYSQEEIDRLDVYETERGHKYAEDYFGMREVVAGDWNVKMNISRIDKFVKQQINDMYFAPTVDNYRKVLSEMEQDIGSHNLTILKRIQRIIHYITIKQKLSHAQELKKRFLESI